MLHACIQNVYALCRGEPGAEEHVHEETKPEDHYEALSQPPSAQELVAQTSQEEDPEKNQEVVESVTVPEVSHQVEPPLKKQKVDNEESVEEPKEKEVKEPKDVVDEEPPLVRRVEQWSAKPAASPKKRAKAKAQPKSNAKAKTAPPQKRGRKPKGTGTQEVGAVEVISDNEVDEQGESIKQESRRQKKDNTTSKRKAKASKVEQKPEGEGAPETTEKEKVEKPIKYKRVDQEGKRDITQAFQWDKPEEDVVDTPELPAQPPAKPQAETPAKPNAGDTGKLKSFARRPQPKTSPSSDKWLAIRDTFYEHVCEWVQFYELPVYSYEASFYII